MNGKFLLVPVVLAWMLASTPVAMAGSAIQQMVGIMLDLHHYPSDSEKVTLKSIVDDGSASQDERTIASALMHMHHTVTDADKTKLMDIANNDAAPEADRKVADILAHMHHKASSDAKQELEMLK